MSIYLEGGFVISWWLLSLALGYLMTLGMVVYAVPANIEVALNHRTKQCAGYWSGDEFDFYPLPAGWVSFVVEYGNGEGPNTVETDVGACVFTGYEDCCDQLGYKFVSEDIGRRGGRWGGSLAVVVGAGFLGLLALGLYKLVRGRGRKGSGWEIEL